MTQALAQAQPLVDIVAAGAAVGALVAIFKFLLQYIPGFKNSQNQVNFTRVFVYAVAAAVTVAYAAKEQVLTFSGGTISDLLTAVLLVGSYAILYYHLLTGLPSPTPPPVAAGSPATVFDLPTQTPPTPTVAAVPVAPPKVEAVSTPASDPAQRI